MIIRMTFRRRQGGAWVASVSDRFHVQIAPGLGPPSRPLGERDHGWCLAVHAVDATGDLLAEGWYRELLDAQRASALWIAHQRRLENLRRLRRRVRQGGSLDLLAQAGSAS